MAINFTTTGTSSDIPIPQSDAPPHAAPTQPPPRMKLSNVAALALATLLSVLSTGCGLTADSSGEAPHWDPCAAFPESAMGQLGFDYKSSAQAPGRECGWLNTKTGYGPDIRYLTKSALDDAWKSEVVSLSEIAIGPYSGYHYRSKGVDPNFVCSVRLKTMNSNVEFSVINQNYGAEDPCPIAIHVATELVGYLPPPAG
ncbi:DUF3558 family protein [Nocardia sp. MW-W600-9]